MGSRIYEGKEQEIKSDKLDHIKIKNLFSWKDSLRQ